MRWWRWLLRQPRRTVLNGDYVQKQAAVAEELRVQQRKLAEARSTGREVIRRADSLGAAIERTLRSTR